LPATADAAVDLALRDNPALAATAAATQAARRDMAGARGAALPTVSVGAGSTFYAYRDRFAGIGNVNNNAAQVGATLTVPLYQGGLVSAQVRQAAARVDEAVDRQRGAEEQVEATVRAAFSSYQSALRAMAATQDALASNSEALRGVRVEADGGERQVLDVLNAEVELLGSKTALERARHDIYVAGFQLLNAMGQVGYKRLNLEGGAIYDPMANYRHARAVLSDFSDHPSPQQKGYSQPKP
jgi:outer membrane protein